MILSFNYGIGLGNFGIEQAEIERNRLFNRYRLPNKLIFIERDLGEHFYTSNLKLSDNNFINIYDYIQHACSVRFHKTEINDLILPHSKVIKHHSYQIIKRGIYSCRADYFYLGYHYCSQIKKAAFYKGNCCYCIDYFDYRGFLSSTITSDYHGGNMEYFYSPQGEVMMTVHIPKHYRHPLYRIKGCPYIISDRQDLIQYFLNSICAKYATDKHPVILIADCWYAAVLLKQLYNIKPRHYLILCAHHSRMIDSNHVLAISPSKWLRLVIKQAKQNDSSYNALVCTDDHQKNRISKGCRSLKSVYSIPASVQDLNGIKHPLSMKRRQKQISYLTWTFSIKKVSKIIKAFALAQRKYSNLTLNIDTLVPLKHEAVKTIDKIGRKYHVKENTLYIRHAEHVSKIYRTSQLALITSRDESADILTLEALSQGCTIISGNDMSKDDYHAMAKKIVKYFKTPKRMQTLSDNAYRQSDHYSPDRMIKKWRRLFMDVKKDEVID